MRINAPRRNIVSGYFHLQEYLTLDVPYEVKEGVETLQQKIMKHTTGLLEGGDWTRACHSQSFEIKGPVPLYVAMMVMM